MNDGYSTLVDESDYEQVASKQWSTCFVKNGTRILVYAQSNGLGSHKNRKHFRLHRILLGAPKGITVDHKNLDGLDNRRSNLRFATYTENNRNRRAKAGKQFKGIYYRGAESPKNPWRATITINRKSIYLGVFSTPEEAARAYDRAAVKYFGEFRLLNFPDEHPVLA
jgi:hypothetical protein